MGSSWAQGFAVERDSYLFDTSDFAGISPEIKLLFAMCERAVRDTLSAIPEERIEAHGWLFEEDNPDIPFSFPWVCDFIGYNMHTLRERVLKIVDRGQGKAGISREIYSLISEVNAA